MASFDSAVTLVLRNEGGFSDNPHDSGQATNFGISLRLLKSLSAVSLHRLGIFHAPEDVSVEDVRALTVDQAKVAYHLVFWDDSRFELIENQGIANQMFDAAVNMGIGNAVKLAQSAYNACRGEHGALVVDGVLGEATLRSLNQAYPIGFSYAFRSERAGYYRELVARNPADVVFLDGWLRRAYSV
jgi:lysozyme family protein